MNLVDIFDWLDHALRFAAIFGGGFFWGWCFGADHYRTRGAQNAQRSVNQ
jgi:hypothetical protein